MEIADVQNEIRLERRAHVRAEAKRPFGEVVAGLDLSSLQTAASVADNQNPVGMRDRQRQRSAVDRGALRAGGDRRGANPHGVIPAGRGARRHRHVDAVERQCRALRPRRRHTRFQTARDILRPLPVVGVRRARAGRAHARERRGKPKRENPCHDRVPRRNAPSRPLRA